MNKEAFDIALIVGQLHEKAFAKLLCTPDLFSITFEVKADFKSAETGNVAIEYAQRDHVKGGYKPSGIQTTKAKFWAILIDYDTWIVQPTDRIRYLINQNPQFKKKPGGDNGNWMVLIPKAELVKIVR